MVSNRPNYHAKKTTLNKIDYSNLLNTKLIKNDKNLILEFLSKNNLKQPEYFDNILNLYNDNKYTFLLIWLGQDKYKNIDSKKINAGILISFNTCNIFFPFKSPAFRSISYQFNLKNQYRLAPRFYVYIIGHKTLNGESNTKVEHLFMNNFPVPNELSDFFFNKTFVNNLYYTKLTHSLSANDHALNNKPLINDFAIINKPPNNLLNKIITNDNFLIISIILILILSLISSALASIITFYKFQPSILKFSFFGIFNLFSLLGLILAAYYFNISNRFTNVPLPPVKFKTDYLSSCIFISLFILFALLALVFFTSPMMPTHGYGEVFLFIFIAVSIIQLILRTNYYNGLYIILFSLFFCFFTVISSIIYYKSYIS